MPKHRTFRRHKIFRSGIHRNEGEQVWPPDRVRGVLDATRRLSPALIPYTLLHPENSLPIYGFARKEDIQGEELPDGGYALTSVLHKFAEEAIPALEAQGLTQVSIGLGKDDEIVHVGFVPKPAVSGLGTVFSEAPVPCSSAVEVVFEAVDLDRPVAAAFAYSETRWHIGYALRQIGEWLAGVREREIEAKGIEAADKFVPTYMIDFLKTPLPEEEPAPEAGAVPSVAFAASPASTIIPDNNAMDEETKQRLAALEAENAALRTSNAEALQRAADLEAATRKAEVTGFLDTIADRVPPSQRDVVESILLDLQSAKPRSFAAADGTTQERSSYEAFKTLLSGAAPVVIFAEVATAANAPVGDAGDKRTVSQRADDETAEQIRRASKP